MSVERQTDEEAPPQMRKANNGKSVKRKNNSRSKKASKLVSKGKTVLVSVDIAWFQITAPRYIYIVSGPHPLQDLSSLFWPPSLPTCLCQETKLLPLRAKRFLLKNYSICRRNPADRAGLMGENLEIKVVVFKPGHVWTVVIRSLPTKLYTIHNYTYSFTTAHFTDLTLWKRHDDYAFRRHFRLSRCRWCWRHRTRHSCCHLVPAVPTDISVQPKRKGLSVSSTGISRMYKFIYACIHGNVHF